jgi:transcriptional regulator with XRE-family HTH domain
MVGETHSNIAFWEKSDKPPRSDVLAKLADALGVTVEELLAPGKTRAKPRNGPVGKLRRTFEDAARLPRAQQDKIIEVVNALVRGLRTGE